MKAELGYTIFYVADVDKSVDFFHTVFELEKKFVTDEKDYGELATGPCTLAFVVNELATTNLETSGGFIAQDLGAKPLGASVTLLCDDVRAAFETACAHGGTAYTAPKEKPWGQTVAYVRDPNGVLVEIATPMAGPPQPT